MANIDGAAIEAGYERIDGYIRRTPVIAARIPGVSRLAELKLECLQHTGSFKPRGAFNTLLSRSIPDAGVAAASGGNHGAAVAYAAKVLGIPAKIFVPTISNPVKVATIRSHGADLNIAGDRYADAQSLCDAYAAQTGALVIHPYDADTTIIGQGSVGLEWERQTEGLDTVLVAVGGGGLVSGIAAWFAGRKRVIAVEPAGSAALNASLEKGGPVDVSVDSVAADSLGAANVGERVYAIASQHVSQSILVEDDAITSAQKHLWRHHRLATEPGGAAAFAAILSGVYRPAKDERVGILVCGANVDLTTLQSMDSD